MRATITRRSGIAATSPEIFGTLETVSADSLEDTRRGTPYFVARIRIAEAELERLGEVELSPGMPAEVFIQTGEQVAINYLLKPLIDSFNRAFKDGSDRAFEQTL